MKSGALSGTLLLASLAAGAPAHALGWGTYGNWDSQARRDAAEASMRAVVNRFNAYGDFNWGSDGWVDVYYNAGVPTAQAGYYGSIDFGGTWPNERVTQHELNHWLGSGTYWNWGNQFSNGVWTGPRVNALMAQFDGDGAVLRQSGVHFYPYGLNYDNEVVNDSVYMRNVALTYAMRQDMGNGNPNNPWSATTVTLTASDPSGTSAFNWFGGNLSGNYGGWSDKHFPHKGASYSTGNFILRTPLDTANPAAPTPSFTFGGDSLTVNNTNGAGGGLRFKGVGTTGVLRINDLILDGGYVTHASGAADHFRLAGRVTLAGAPTIDAAQGPITITANINGGGSLTKAGAHTLTLAGGNAYAGSTSITAGTLRLAPAAPVASYTFDNVSGGAVANAGTGGSAMNGALAGGATIVAGGRFGSAVSLASGASVNINNPIADLGNDRSWTVSVWVKTATPGGSILTKGDGVGWGYGNTIFYLGDGSAGGSGGLPSGVRWAGGFFQAAPGTPAVTDNAWHQITYVNDAGNYAIYVDGVARALSAGNAGFSVPDVGSVVRLGASTNTVAGDGTINFNGLLDSVQFYGQALSAAQIAALYQGLSVGPLPATTDVAIAAGATLDVNGVTQQVASLSGPAGSSVTLGVGRLTLNSPADSLFAGTISGGGGSLVKAGAGTLTLAGANSYTGPTTVNAGTLRVTGSVANSSKVIVAGPGTFEAAGAAPSTRSAAVTAGGTLRIAPAAGSPPRRLTIGDGTHTFVDAGAAALAISGGTVDVTDNALVVRFAPGSDARAAAAVRAHLAAARNGAAADWRGAGITADAAIADPAARAVGYALSSELLGPTGGTFMGAPVDGSSVVVRATLAGDATLDGRVDFADLVRLAQTYDTSGPAVDWLDGDFDYDGAVNFTDLVMLAQNYDTALPTAPVPGAPADFQAELAAAAAAVPEPGTALIAAAAALAGAAARRRRR
jgi:autotransporter-associated beta strand protein